MINNEIKVMKKLSIFLALSLILGGKAFAQYEFEYFEKRRNRKNG